MHDSKSFISNISWLIVGTLLSNIISIFVSIFIIRKLPVEDFGIYSLFLGSLAFFSLFSVTGILVALRRFIPELIKKKYFQYLKNLIVKAYSFGGLLSFICIVIVFFFKNEIGDLLKINKFDVYYTIFAINIFLYLQNSLSSIILISMYQQKILQIAGLLSMIVRGALYAIFLSQINIELIFIIEAVSVAVKAVLEIYFAIRAAQGYSKGENIPIPDAERTANRKRFKRYALLSTTNEMGTSVLSEVSDYYFISAYLGPHALGLYAYPNKILKLIFHWVPISSINNVVRPFFIGKYYSENENLDYLSRVFNFFLKVVTLIYGAICAVVIGYQSLINIVLFKAKYSETETLLIVILSFFLLRSMEHPVNTVMEITEKIQYNVYSKMFAVFNVLTTLFVLNYTNWSLIGVAVSTGISGFLKNYYIYFYMKRLSGIKIIAKEQLRIAAILVPTVAVMYFTSLIPNMILKSLLPILSGTIVFYVVYKNIKPWNEDELSIINKLLEKTLFRLKFVEKIYQFIK